MKGRWHVFFAVLAVTLLYLVIRVEPALALVAIPCALVPDWDILLFGSYRWKDGEWKWKTGIGSHRDGIFHSACFPVVFYTYLLVFGGTATSWAACAYVSVAFMSHLVADLKHAKGKVRFLRGKLVLRGSRSTLYLLLHSSALVLVIMECIKYV